MIITREALVEEQACSDGIRFFDEHFPAGEGTQEEVFEAIEKYAPMQDWQVWLARKLRLTVTFRTWRDDGKTWVEELYVEGKRHGLRRVWWEDGQPQEEIWDHGVRIV